MRRPTFILSILLIIAPLAATAQQQGPPRDPQAMAVLRNAHAAQGGANAASIQDTVIQATVIPPGQTGETGTATFKTKGTDKIRSDASSGGKSASVIFNKGREYRSSDQGMKLAHSANAEHKRIEHLPVLMIAQEISRGDFSADYIGQETVESHTVHHVRLFRISHRNPAIDATSTKNSELNVYVDTQTFLILKISFPYVAENDWRQSLPMEIYYGDYRLVNGMQIPFHQRFFYGGEPAGELQFSSVAVNQGTPDSVFDGRNK